MGACIVKGGVLRADQRVASTSFTIICLRAFSFRQREFEGIRTCRRLTQSLMRDSLRHCAVQFKHWRANSALDLGCFCGLALCVVHKTMKPFQNANQCLSVSSFPLCPCSTKTSLKTSAACEAFYSFEIWCYMLDGYWTSMTSALYWGWERHDIHQCCSSVQSMFKQEERGSCTALQSASLLQKLTVDLLLPVPHQTICSTPQCTVVWSLLYTSAALPYLWTSFLLILSAFHC